MTLHPLLCCHLGSAWVHLLSWPWCFCRTNQFIQFCPLESLFPFGCILVSKFPNILCILKFLQTPDLRLYSSELIFHHIPTNQWTNALFAYILSNCDPSILSFLCMLVWFTNRAAVSGNSSICFLKFKTDELFLFSLQDSGNDPELLEINPYLHCAGNLLMWGWKESDCTTRVLVVLDWLIESFVLVTSRQQIGHCQSVFD